MSLDELIKLLKKHEKEIRNLQHKHSIETNKTDYRCQKDRTDPETGRIIKRCRLRIKPERWILYWIGSGNNIHRLVLVTRL